ncbi:sorting nexin-24 isoform X3 [Haemorhous mexicanus]|uniref:sorting nexin-24 isoform X3 n=1 Tax=Haemorhous mexicanus TaxID=30427 RepID=UPI0028BE1560|nr:sorting nexin-24 isoform X3 [Haemorhous mexicanus]
MEVFIPSFRYEESELERGYTVFKIEVLVSGRKHFVEKRYSEFHALHKKTVILENEELPKIFLDFLNVRHVPTLPKAESCGSFDETESEESSKLSHQPVLLFLRDPYVLPKANEEPIKNWFLELHHLIYKESIRSPLQVYFDDFPNVVIDGILHGIFYPHLLPR